MASVVMIFSGKGGAGKSFVASNLACGFEMLQKRTLLIDFAFGIRSDASILGLTDSVLFNIGDVMRGECKLDEAVIRSEKDYVPDFLASSVNEPDADYDLKKSVRKIIKEISNEYDFIIFDCTSCIGAEFDACCSVADILLAITGEDAFSVGNTALRIAKAEAQLPARKYLILNKIVITNGETDDICAEDIIDEIGLPLIGIVPEDEYALKSMISSDPLIRYSTPAGIALENVCRRIMGECVPYKTYKKPKSIFEKNKLILKNKQGGY